MKNIPTALEYHDRTKHRPQAYAASLGYMDWATQPNPFRRYEGADLIPLTFSDSTPPYHLLFKQNALPVAPLCLESLSQLLRYCLGLAAIKSQGGSSWALRCNASSGNLQPSECYVIAPAIEGISTKSTLSHYAPREHALELLHTYEDELPEGTFLIALSSIIWREAWKYGERSWRYCQLDAGHAYESIKISAAMLGWKCEILSVETQEISRLCGLDQLDRFNEYEHESPDMLLRFCASDEAVVLPKTPKLNAQANILSPSHHDWPVLTIIDEATQGLYPITTPLHTQRLIPSPTQSAGEIILKRRSAQAMDGSSITQAQFRQILDSSRFCDETSDVHFMMFVHRVEGLEKGLYAFIRNGDDLDALKSAMDATFAWEDCDDGVYCLQKGDYRGVSQRISCNQEIAKEGAFSFGMVCRFSKALETHGAIGYKNLYHQCGAIGQMLYLESTALGLSATGIGCFLDDEFHALLGLQDQRFQSLYHFTIGRAIVDTRITTLPPY
ncbi:MAG TPA: SagB/ThcOx family dehydrogenase [Sulfuricurvum sp.]|nr:SagB/ThcOx family dehydrogenase [Sulfuricurvum sp.]